MLRDPLAAFSALQRDYGDAVRVPYSPKRAFFVLSRPEDAEHVLVQHQDRYVKAFTYRPLRAFLGDGLLTSEGDTWKRHRRLVQPVFSHRHVQSFAPAIVEAATERAAGWTPGAPFDLAAEMRTLTMDVVGRVLFGTDLAAEAESVGKAVSRLQAGAIAAAFLPASISPERTRKLATHALPGLGRAASTLESMVSRIIDERLAAPHPEPTDLLDRLLAAGADEQPLSRQEIQDEVMTLILAGHETTANTLTWAFVLLSRYPAARDRLVAEVANVVGDRIPEAADVESLEWTQSVVSETMRLYPPAWTVERDAIQDDNIAGVEVSAGDTVSVSAYLIHRNPELWPNPEGFDPSRFLPDQASGRPKYAFLPFGGGRRICVGAGLAQLETTLALAVIARAANLDLVAGASVHARASVALATRGPVWVTPSVPNDPARLRDT